MLNRCIVTCHLAAQECTQRPCQLLKHQKMSSSFMPQESHTTVDSICLLIRDLNAEFLRRCQNLIQLFRLLKTDLLDRHHNLNGVQAVQAKVVREMGCRWKLWLINLGLELYTQDVLYLGWVGNLQNLSAHALANTELDILYQSSSTDQLFFPQLLISTGRQQQSNILQLGKQMGRIGTWWRRSLE